MVFLRVVSYGTDYSTSVVVPLNTWFHISVGYDGTYNTIFLNGIMVDRRSFSFNTGTHTHLYVNAEKMDLWSICASTRHSNM